MMCIAHPWRIRVAEHRRCLLRMLLASQRPSQNVAGNRDRCLVNGGRNLTDDLPWFDRRMPPGPQIQFNARRELAYQRQVLSIRERANRLWKMKRKSVGAKPREQSKLTVVLSFSAGGASGLGSATT